MTGLDYVLVLIAALAAFLYTSAHRRLADLNRRVSKLETINIVEAIAIKFDDKKKGEEG